MGKYPDNLFKRGEIWWIRYNADGREIRKSLRTKSVREAKRIRDKILAHRSIAAELGIDAPRPRKSPRFSEISELWLKSKLADGSLRSASIETYDRDMRLWIVPYFGDRRMDTITADDIERFIGHLRTAISSKTGDPLSDTYIAHIFASLRAMYRKAIKRRWYVGLNPLDQLDCIPRRGPGRRVALTEEHARVLLDELSGRLYYKVGLALYTGLRWGEVHGLLWTNLALDADTPTYTVERSFRGPPKNRASAATVALCDDAVALLRRWQQVQGIGARVVFPNRRGEIYRGKQPRDADLIHDAADRAGITVNVTPHVLRHTFGTWVYERTGDPKLVQRLMRHATFATSMQYVHDRRALRDIVNQLPTLTQPRLTAV